MSIVRRRRYWLALLPVALLALSTAQVWAADTVTLEIQAPEQAGLGDKVAVVASLRDGNGAPVPGVDVLLWTTSTFLTTGGSIELGRAFTDRQGKATFTYEARSQGAIPLNVYFSGNSRYAPAQASVELAVQGSAQLYQSTAGVRVPGVGVWLLAALLGGVWSIYFTVFVFVTLIAREGTEAAHGAGGHGG